MRKHLVIATRGSRLALWQAEHVKSRLEAQDPGLTVSLNVIKTKGDIILDVPLSKVGGKGLFVKEIEEALLDGRADLAVHSIKDVPMVLPEGLILGCVPQREACTDCFLSVHYADPDALPQKAHVGTSSLRRQAQLLSMRPDLRISSLRGNVDTRLRKLQNGEYDAIILASAGLNRLGLSAPYMAPLDPERFLPAVGQGALGIECREDNYDLLVLLASWKIAPPASAWMPSAAFWPDWKAAARCPSPGMPPCGRGNRQPQGTGGRSGRQPDPARRKNGNAADARALGLELAGELLNKGGRAILEKLYQQQ